jgi:hypothetical protein
VRRKELRAQFLRQFFAYDTIIHEIKYMSSMAKNDHDLGKKGINSVV